MNWWLLSCIASGAIGLILAFVLGAFYLADEADRKSQRIVRDLRAEADHAALWGDQHPHRSDRS